jgi:dTDP-4-amino-4,6-dideoxygalactose transaminase
MIWRCDLVPQTEAYRTEILQAIERVLPSGRYILAGECAAFEQEYANYLGAKHCTGVANGTDGLTLALRAFDIGLGDEVITTPYTAIPTASAIIDAGATPVFVDIDPDTFLIDLNQVIKAITNRTRAIMPVHIFGNVVDIPKLRSLLPESIHIIEDAAQSHGSTFRGVQSGTMGDAGVFSFYPTKNLGALGDGGAVVTNCADIDARLRLLRMYGMVDKDTIVCDGVNSRLDEIQAAILRAKLPYLEAMNAARRRIAARYIAELPPDSFTCQSIPGEVVTNWHVFVARYHGDRARFIAHMDSRGVQTNVYYVTPLHLQEAHRSLGYSRGVLPFAENLCSDAIALPFYPEMTHETHDIVFEAIHSFQK